MKNIKVGSNPVEIKKGIDEAVAIVVKQLENMAVEITDDAQIKEVAVISSNNDEEVGNLIITALDKVGREGIVTIEESKTGETYLETVEGMEFTRGYVSPYFVTDNGTMTAMMEDPYIMIYDGVLQKSQDIVNSLQVANTDNRPLVIIANEIGGEALATLIVNKMRGIVNVVGVKSPDFGDRRTMALEDLATITGGKVISYAKGQKIEKLQPVQLKELFGSARNVNVGKDKTTVIDGRGSEEDIEARAEEVKTLLDKATSPFEKEKLQERLGKIVGGVAIINVGGNSEIEMKEKKDRVEDALYASLAALDEGIIIGGGTALLYAAQLINIEGNDDIAVGRRIVRKAIQSPFLKILTNAGHDINDALYAGSKLVDTNEDKWLGLDYKDLSTINFKEAGIIDPKKVTRVALQNAASVAGTILTTDAAVVEKGRNEDAPPQQQWDPNGII